MYRIHSHISNRASFFTGEFLNNIFQFWFTVLWYIGGEGSPVVIMNGAGGGGGGGGSGGSGLGTSRPGSSSGKSEKRFGFDRKRMLLPSPAFGFVSPKQPQSRSQTSMSCYSEQPQPWYVWLLRPKKILINL